MPGESFGAKVWRKHTSADSGPTGNVAEPAGEGAAGRAILEDAESVPSEVVETGPAVDSVQSESQPGGGVSLSNTPEAYVSFSEEVTSMSQASPSAPREAAQKDTAPQATRVLLETPFSPEVAAKFGVKEKLARYAGEKVGEKFSVSRNQVSSGVQTGVISIATVAAAFGLLRGLGWIDWNPAEDAQHATEVVTVLGAVYTLAHTIGSFVNWWKNRDKAKNGYTMKWNQ